MFSSVLTNNSNWESFTKNLVTIIFMFRGFVQNSDFLGEMGT